MKMGRRGEADGCMGGKGEWWVDWNGKEGRREGGNSGVGKEGERGEVPVVGEGKRGDGGGEGWEGQAGG